MFDLLLRNSSESTGSGYRGFGRPSDLLFSEYGAKRISLPSLPKTEIAYIHTLNLSVAWL